MAHTNNSSTCGVKAEESRIQDLPRVHSGTLSHKSLIHTQKKPMNEKIKLDGDLF